MASYDWLAVPAVVLYGIMIFVSTLGFIQIAFFCSRRNRTKIDRAIRDQDLVGVTILRPLKGVDPEMAACLESSFQQEYPKDRLEIIFCVQDPKDKAVQVVQELIAKYPEVDAKLLVDAQPCSYGPNPKINNLAKGYKAAKFDLLWVIDSNAWARPDTLRRSVYTMTHDLHNGSKVYRSAMGCTLGSPLAQRRVLLVNHTPLAVALDGSWGSNLDEMFLSSSHSKFYVALNTLSIAPCINGKSTLYRRSDLDCAVGQIGKQAVPSTNGLSGQTEMDAAYYGSKEGEGIRFFARYIAEDNMIAIALWENMGGRAGMSTDSVIQPLGGTNTVANYMDRRVRWLRVRKYMVMAATLVEPTTECLLCGLIGTYGVSVLFLHCRFSFAWFCMHVLIWFCTDYVQFHLLRDHIRSGCSELPYFLGRRFHFEGTVDGHPVRTLAQFVPVWLTRELLAFPIWARAMLGSRIDWRGQNFRIKSDLTAEAII